MTLIGIAALAFVVTVAILLFSPCVSIALARRDTLRAIGQEIEPTNIGKP